MAIWIRVAKQITHVRMMVVARQVSASPSKSVTSALPTSIKVAATSPVTSTAASNAIQPQAFWAGATIDTVLRMEAIAGRTFYDFGGTTVKDPI